METYVRAPILHSFVTYISNTYSEDMKVDDEVYQLPISCCCVTESSSLTESLTHKKLTDT
jgi:hypothetical protein